MHDGVCLSQFTHTYVPTAIILSEYLRLIVCLVATTQEPLADTKKQLKATRATVTELGKKLEEQGKKLEEHGARISALERQIRPVAKQAGKYTKRKAAILCGEIIHQLVQCLTVWPIRSFQDIDLGTGTYLFLPVQGLI